MQFSSYERKYNPFYPREATVSFLCREAEREIKQLVPSGLIYMPQFAKAKPRSDSRASLTLSGRAVMGGSDTAFPFASHLTHTEEIPP